MGTLDGNSIDTNCIERIANGDESGLTELISRYSRRLRGYLRKHSIADDLQDEVVQDVFLKVWANAKSFIIGECVARWVITITRNTMLDSVRKQRRIDRNVSLSQYLAYTDSGLVDGYACIEAVAAESDKSMSADDLLEMAAEVLPSIYLDEVAAYADGWATPERSRQTGIPEATLRWRRLEAFKQLRNSRKFANAFAD
jgi:RNA polymerase sigma factor (sigma-70 family)